MRMILKFEKDLSSKYRSVKFNNLSISSLGIFGISCNSFIAMCNDLNIDKQQLHYALRKITAIIIRSSYYIFCMRNKPWANPDLLTYWTIKILLSHFVAFSFSLFFNFIAKYNLVSKIQITCSQRDLYL